jgi:hypothetical protein
MAVQHVRVGYSFNYFLLSKNPIEYRTTGDQILICPGSQYFTLAVVEFELHASDN